jgi:hypothetical protein
MSMATSSDIIGNRTRDLPACIEVPHQLHHRVPPVLGTDGAKIAQDPTKKYSKRYLKN